MLNRAVANESSASEPPLSDESKSVPEELLQKLSDGVCFFKPDGSVSQANPAMAKLLGLTSEELPGKQLRQLVAEQDVPLVEAMLEKTQEGISEELDCRWLTKSGNEIWSRCNILPLSREGKSRSGAVAIVQDIGAKRQADEARAKLAAIFESSDDIIVGKDLDGTIRSWNKAAERVFGYTEEEMLGQSILKIVPPDRHAEEHETLEKLSRGERIDHFQTVRIAKDGREVQISLTVSPIRDSEGLVIGASKVARDITEQLQLNEAQARLAAIVEFSDDAIASKDLNGIVKTWNKGAEALFGYSAEDIIGKSIQILLPPDRRGEENLILDRLRRGYPIEHYETIRQRKDGRLIDVSVTVSPIRSPDGKIIGASKVARDITERRRSEQALKESEAALRELTEQLEERVRQRTADLEFANKEMEGFTYSVSHDLRAPLRAIVGSSKMAMEDFAGKLPDDVEEHLARQAAAAEKLAVLIDGLLQLSRVARASVQRRPFDLTKLATEIATELRRSDPDRPVDFAIQPEMIAIADSRLLRLVAQNLLDNAWKFSPEGGVVSVGARQIDNETIYFVRDQGIGFDMKYAPKIFLPFERLVRDEDFPGTGIGLANVNRIIDRHGGKVWAESSPGKGTTIYFTLAPRT